MFTEAQRNALRDAAPVLEAMGRWPTDSELALHPTLSLEVNAAHALLKGQRGMVNPYAKHLKKDAGNADR